MNNNLVLPGICGSMKGEKSELDLARKFYQNI